MTASLVASYSYRAGRLKILNELTLLGFSSAIDNGTACSYYNLRTVLTEPATDTDNKVLYAVSLHLDFSANLYGYALLDKLYQGRDQRLIIVLWNLFSQ